MDSTPQSTVSLHQQFTPQELFQQFFTLLPRTNVQFYSPQPRTNKPGTKQSRVKVLYDFEADPEFGELPVTKGEILTVTNKDVGEGWWYGTNVNGEAGIFPIDYVEAYDIEGKAQVRSKKRNRCSIQ